MELNSDGTLSIAAATVDAAGLDALILQMANARMQMQPEVPRSLDLDAGGTLVTIDVTELEWGVADDAVPTLCLRSPGFGWLAYAIQTRELATLHAVIGRHLARHQVAALSIDPAGGAQTH
jgi:hypothetical protein